MFAILRKAVLVEVNWQKCPPTISKAGVKTYLWKARCSGCGTDVYAQSGYRSKHSGKCRSCCQKGPEYTSAYGAMATSAKRKNFLVMSLEEYANLRHKGSCHYCWGAIITEAVRGEPGYRGYFIDRKDNNSGYQLTNSVLCCTDCNFAKGDRYTYEEFYAMSESLRRVRDSKRARVKTQDTLRTEFLNMNDLHED